MLDISTMLFFHEYPEAAGDEERGAPKPEDPTPEGGEGERAGDDGDVQPLPSGEPRKPPPMVPEPAAPDANPIDPRVFRRR